MATPFAEIYDLFLIEVQDYKLDKLYQSSPTDFNTYLQGFLIRAIPEFTNCKKNLEDIDLTLKQFNQDLSMKEKDILCKYMTIQWLNREVNNVTQFNLVLNDTDFRRYAEGQNLKEKTTHRDKLREMVSQDCVDYGLLTNDWSAWASGNYD